MSIVKSNDNFDRLEPYKDMIKQKINFILKNDRGYTNFYQIFIIQNH